MKNSGKMLTIFDKKKRKTMNVVFVNLEEAGKLLKKLRKYERNIRKK